MLPGLTYWDSSRAPVRSGLVFGAGAGAPSTGTGGGLTLPKSTTKQMAFFFTAWPAKGSTAPLQFSMEILQNNRSLGQTSAQLPAADEQGQIKYASAFPLDKFQPGVYELKVTVSDGKNRVSHSTPFTIAP